MNSLGIFVYAVVRFFYYIEKDRVKVFIKMLFKVVLYYLVGLSIGAFIFIPSAYGFLNTARVPSMEIDLFSTLRNYLKIFVRFIINDKYPRISLPLIAFPCAALFLHFKSRLSKSYQ